MDQQGCRLPEGPLLTSPGTLYESIKQEIISTVDMFKIKVLRRIKKVFSDTIHNPIYAGFGNRTTDALAYSVIGIENHRIFTI